MKKPGINTFSGTIEEDGRVKVNDDMILDFEGSDEFNEGDNVVVRINTADVLLDDIEESDFTGVISDIKKRDIYYDVYIKVGDNVIVASTSSVYHVGEETGVWIKEEKVKVKIEESEEIEDE